MFGNNKRVTVTGRGNLALLNNPREEWQLNTSFCTKLVVDF